MPICTRIPEPTTARRRGAALTWVAVPALAAGLLTGAPAAAAPGPTIHAQGQGTCTPLEEPSAAGWSSYAALRGSW